VYRDKDLRRVGFEVDLAEALAGELGRPIEFKQYPFESLIPGLLKGDFDFAMNGLEITPERKQVVRFSRPYYVYRQQLVVRVGEDRFKTLKGCRELPGGGVIGTMEATAAERLLDDLNIKKKSYLSPTEAYQDLALGRIDAVLIDYPMAVAYAARNDRLKFAGRPTAKGYYAIAFRPDDNELAEQVDAALGRLMERGELRRIYRKWGIWNDAQEELMPGNLFEEDDNDEAPAVDVVAESRSGWSLTAYLPLLLEGALVTVQLSFLSFALAIAIGLPVALARLYGPVWMRGLATGYVEYFRGIPVLLLLFFLYYGLPAVAQDYGLGGGLSLSPFQAAVLGFGLNYAAYEAEIYRAGLLSIPTGQWEAAASLGMSGPLTFQRIILPQAVRVLLPPMTSDFVALFKDTSIASTITVVELMKQYQILSKSSLKFVEIGLVTAALYLVMSVPLGYLSRHLERRWSHA
jgi:polar amino acid transport system substrate-binding protein